MITRREFCRLTAASAALASASSFSSLAQEGKRKFTINLMPGMIGVSVKSQRETNELAARHGFESVEPMGGELARISQGDLEQLLEQMRGQRLVWGAAGLPVNFRGDQAPFQSDLARLPQVAAGLQRAGVERMGTWITPSSNELTYQKNFARHVERLGQIGRILNDHGIKLGLEYIGTYTLRSNRRFHFIHTMEECAELISALPTKNFGLTLDSWHWWTAEDKVEDILKLKPEQVVAVDLNDAPLGRKKEEQLDGQRELPAATGVIPVADFLKALVQIGYNGPVRAEPFNRPLNELDNDAACAATAAAIKAAISKAGLQA